MRAAKEAPQKARPLLVGLDGRVAMAAVMIMVAALYGVKLTDMSPQMTSRLETAMLHSLCGSNRPWRSKEIVFTMLVTGTIHGTTIHPDLMADSVGTPQALAWAVWEAVATPKPTGPLARAMHELKKPGWLPLPGWWKWTYLGFCEDTPRAHVEPHTEQ